jgi:hypothetical protein
MRANLAALSFSIFVGAVVCSAQTAPEATAPVGPQPDYTSVYCSGFVSDPKVPTDTQIISGEQSNYKILFGRGEYVYINRGEDKGVKVGDRYTIVRPDRDEANEWFKRQERVSKAAGTLYRDGGQVRIVNVQPKVSVAEVTFSCGGYMQRGDLARPFEERPIPALKSTIPFDHFAPVSGKPIGTVFTSQDFWQVMGKGNIAYVNVGASKGAKVGDYMRIFRYQGPGTEYASVTSDDHYKIYGFGSAPARYKGTDLPREILGEGIVLNVSRGSATVLITYSTAPMYAGDDAEIE